MAEARTGKRFPLTLPITIREDKAPTSKKGKTVNVSAAGVYIQSESKLELGSKVEFDITLPKEVVGAEKDVSVHCQGRVVRLDPPAKAGKGSKKKAKSGVGCVIDEYKFIRKS